MGIFGSRKETYVSSVLYNLAGDETKRADYLKTTVVGAIIHDTPSMADSIVNSYLRGPGIRFRSFMRWALNSGYTDTVGLVTGNIMTGNSIDEEVIKNELPATPGTVINLQSTKISEADYTYWADQWVAENYPERLTSQYETDFDEIVNEITITWDDLSFDTFTPVGYDKYGMYLYVVYTEVTEEEIMPLEVGPIIELLPTEDFPDTTGWTLVFHEEVGDEIHDIYERTRYMGQAPDRDAVYSLFERMYQDTVAADRTYQIDSQITYHQSSSPMKVFIYEQGDGNAILDEMFAPAESAGQFFPFIPFRIDNESVSDEYLPLVYEQAKKAFRKATGNGRYDDVQENIEDNEDIDDIDFTYVVFGVSLNVKENACRKYVYNFFKEILNDWGSGEGEYAGWEVAFEAARASWDTWAVWREAQNDSENPLYGTPEPTRLAYPAAPTKSIRVSSGSNPTMNYDMTISWLQIKETVGFGSLKEDAKRDELWFEIGAADDLEEIIWGEEGSVWAPVVGATFDVNELVLNWQVTPNQWRRLHITGLKHRNQVYGGKGVEISAKDALEDAEESGFLVPLHMGVYRAMGLVDGTQMATASAFLVFNCYQVVKKKWYQTGLFAVILIIVIIVVAFYTGYFDPSTAGGILGTNAAVGAALGFTGTVAIIVGAVANALAAMLLTRIITDASTAIFGEKWGAIIGAIASVVALQVGTSMASGQSFASSFNGMMRAENILRLTNAAGKGYSEYVQASVADIAKQNEEVLSQYEEQSREIARLWEQNIGYGRGIIDPLTLTESFGVTMESMDSFLQRTLMTGSDVAGLSLDMLTNFVDMTLNTDLPT